MDFEVIGLVVLVIVAGTWLGLCICRGINRTW